MENQTTKTEAENYIFKPFNLDEALKYPHRVWNGVKKQFAETAIEREVETYKISIVYKDGTHDTFTKDGKLFYMDTFFTLHLLDVEEMLNAGIKLPQHIYEIENILPSKSVEQFIEFNLELALQKPHLVRHKTNKDFRCKEIENSDATINIKWEPDEILEKRYYIKNTLKEYLHMLVDNKETETNTQQQPNKTIPDHYKLPNGMDIIDIIQLLGLNFNTGSALKYMGRAGKKNNESILDDLRKAQECIRREILYYEKLEAQNKQSK